MIWEIVLPRIWLPDRPPDAVMPKELFVRVLPATSMPAAAMKMPAPRVKLAIPSDLTVEPAAVAVNTRPLAAPATRCPSMLTGAARFPGRLRFTPSIDMGPMAAGSWVTSVIVRSPGVREGMSKMIDSAPGAPLAACIACRSDPGPASAEVVTTSVLRRSPVENSDVLNGLLPTSKKVAVAVYHLPRASTGSVMTNVSVKEVTPSVMSLSRTRVRPSYPLAVLASSGWLRKNWMRYGRPPDCIVPEICRLVPPMILASVSTGAGMPSLLPSASRIPRPPFP